MQHTPPNQIGPYRVERALAQRGPVTLYAARHQSTDQPVTLAVFETVTVPPLPDAETRRAMLATGMEDGMEASYARLENMAMAGVVA